MAPPLNTATLREEESDMDTKIMLGEREIPSEWYNIVPDLPFSMPPATSPKTGYPIGSHELEDLFPKALIEQELDRGQRRFKVPDEVREVYALWRPTPVFRAQRLERALETPAQVFYKYEGVSPSGSHELNTAVPQAYYSTRQGVRRITTGTGAGEWGIALAMACKFFDIACDIFMVRAAYQQKLFGRTMMQIWGAGVTPSPSPDTFTGKRVLSEDPDSTGSLGMAISDAVASAMSQVETKYALGSVMNHVMLHQTVIGLEAKRQMEMAKAYPDIVIGCVGGGSNFAGLTFPFVADNLKKKRTRFVAVEPMAAPSLTRGRYAYDYPDSGGLMPMLKMHTLGHDFVPPHIRAGSMRYHGMSPLVSALYDNKLIEAVAHHQNDVLESAILFAQCEGIVPAPESAYAIKAVVEEALACKSSRERKTILFALNAHGYFDLDVYQAYLDGKVEHFQTPEGKIEEALARLPTVQGNAP